MDGAQAGLIHTLDDTLEKVHTLDAADERGNRPSARWFACMEELRLLCEAQAINYDCDHTQILPNVLTAANGMCTRMVLKMQPADQGYQNTQAVHLFGIGCMFSHSNPCCVGRTSLCSSLALGRLARWTVSSAPSTSKSRSSLRNGALELLMGT